MTHKDEPKHKKASTVREYVDSLLVTVILALFGTTFLVQAFKIPSSSMERTLLVGDHLLVNKFIFADTEDSGWRLLPYRPVRRHDIIVFKYPFPPHQHFVKRVVGMPGDRLKIVDRTVYIDGVPLEEDFTIQQRPPLPGSFQDNFPPPMNYIPYSIENGWDREIALWTEGDELIIPPDKYFVMGDNRDNSQDSRYWGFVDRKNIIGRPLLIYFPGNGSSTSSVDSLRQFFSTVRWGRMLHLVR